MPPCDGREVRKKRPPDPAVTQRTPAQERRVALHTRVVTNDVPARRFPLTSGAARIVESLRNSAGLARARSRSFSGTMSRGIFRRQRHVRETARLHLRPYNRDRTRTGPFGREHGGLRRRPARLHRDGANAPTHCQCIGWPAVSPAALGIPIGAQHAYCTCSSGGSATGAPVGAAGATGGGLRRLSLADETPLKMQHPDKKGYVWTFIADNLIVYRFSPSRSGRKQRAGRAGRLDWGARRGHVHRLQPGHQHRRKAHSLGCLAHARRKLFDALSTAPEAKTGLDFIRGRLLVEHERQGSRCRPHDRASAG